MATPGIQPIPHPVNSLKSKGHVDLFDESDLARVVPAELFEQLKAANAALSDKSRAEQRIMNKIITVRIEIELSLLQLLREFGEKPASEATSRKFSQLPLSAFTVLEGESNWKPFDPALLNTRCIVAAANLSVLHNGFQVFLKEQLRIGSTLCDHYMSVQQYLEPHSMMIQQYRQSIQKGQLSFYAQAGEGQKYTLVPMLAKPELVRLMTTAFLSPQMAVIKGTYLHDGKVYFPEWHGLAERLKSNLLESASEVRVFAAQVADPDIPLYLRLSKERFDHLYETVRTKEFDPHLSRETCLANHQIWLCYKTRNEVWLNKDEQQRLQELGECAETTQMHKVVLDIRMSVLFLDTSAGDDWYRSQSNLVGLFPPLVPYFDPLGETGSVQVPVMKLVAHLGEHKEQRQKMKETKAYLQKLQEK